MSGVTDRSGYGIVEGLANATIRLDENFGARTDVVSSGGTLILVAVFALVSESSAASS